MKEQHTLIDLKTTEEIAEELGVRITKVFYAIRSRNIPEAVRLGRKVRGYTPDQVQMIRRAVAELRPRKMKRKISDFANAKA